MSSPLNIQADDFVLFGLKPQFATMPSDFLMQQMEWREALEDAREPQALEALLDEAASWQKAALAKCANLIDQAQDYAAAAQVVRQLLFVEKFIADVENALAH